MNFYWSCNRLAGALFVCRAISGRTYVLWQQNHSPCLHLIVNLSQCFFLCSLGSLYRSCASRQCMAVHTYFDNLVPEISKPCYIMNHLFTHCIALLRSFFLRCRNARLLLFALHSVVSHLHSSQALSYLFTLLYSCFCSLRIACELRKRA